MTSGDADDPQRRAFLRALAAFGVAGVSSIGARVLFGGSGASEIPTALSPLSTSTSTSTSSTTTSTTTTPRATSTSTIPEPIVLEVIPKAGWGARETGLFDSHEIVQLTYHHSASDGSDPEGAADRIRSYQRYHQNQGWPDVAYHYLIDQAGRIYEGRPVDAPGDTFTEYDPTGHFLVCLDGNFDMGPPSDESVEALVLMLAWAAQAFDISPDTLAGHRDHAVTTCPGSFAYELRDDVAARVTALLEEGRPLALTLTQLTLGNPERARQAPHGG